MDGAVCRIVGVKSAEGGFRIARLADGLTELVKKVLVNWLAGAWCGSGRRIGTLTDRGC